MTSTCCKPGFGLDSNRRAGGVRKKTVQTSRLRNHANAPCPTHLEVERINGASGIKKEIANTPAPIFVPLPERRKTDEYLERLKNHGALRPRKEKNYQDNTSLRDWQTSWNAYQGSHNDLTAAQAAISIAVKK